VAPKAADFAMTRRARLGHSETLSNWASRIRSRATTLGAQLHELFIRARADLPYRFAVYPYLDVASGSIPLFLIASKARAEARNSISRLEASISPDPATTAAENV
jgi:hypothetical protein